METAKIFSRDSLNYSHSRRVLVSGLTIVEVHQPHLHCGTIAVFFKSGSRYETAEDNGLSHFLEHMIFRGTENYASAYDLNLAVERLGGTLFAATGPDSTEFQMNLPKESLSSGAKLLAEVVTRPIFSDIEIERRVIAEEIREDLDEEGNTIDIDFLTRRRLWPGHPLGQSVTGPLDNVLRFSEACIRRHFHNYYIARNAVVCLSGAFDRDMLTPLVEQEFSRIPDRSIELKAIPIEFGRGPTSLHTHRPGSQTHVRIAFHAPHGEDPDRVPLSILLGVLDDGMSTRLHRRIFDELGLAYYVCADVEYYADAGVLNIDAAASHGNVAKIVKQVEMLITLLKDQPVDNGELEKAKHRGIWGLESFLDDSHAMGSWYGEQELHFRPQRLADRIQSLAAVTKNDISRVARRIFRPENVHITTVGVLDDKAQKEVESLTLCFR